MKVIIDIPKKDYDKMCKGELINTILVAIKNGTPIPEGATNGDMIMAIFPYINDRPNRVQDEGSRIVIYIDMGFGWRTIEFEKDWWDAPYNYNKEVEE